MVKEISGDEFELEVKKSKTPVVVDYWAEWCVAPDTEIFLSPLHSKNAYEIKESDSVLSFYNELTTDNIIHSKTTNKDGHCKKITTTTGRYLETTDDHAFFTKRGWISAIELEETDEVAILPVADKISFEGEDKILVDKSDFNFLNNEYKFLNNFLKELEQKNLLPLKKNDQRLPIIARLVGALFSDGSLYRNKKNNYREISFSLGQKKDVDDVINDLKAIGFYKAHISERTNEGDINGRKFSMHTFKVKCLSTALYLLFRVLGVSEGNKTNQLYKIPEWIIKSEKAIKKEFLSAYLGGDGPKVAINMQYRKNKNPTNQININDIEFHKREDLVKNGIEYANQISQLLNEFGIDIKNIFYEIDPYLRKDGTKSAIIHIKIANKVNNGFILTQRIGYSYCWQKQINGMYVGEFLREIMNKRASWKFLYDQVIALGKMGYGYRRISKILKINHIRVYMWLKKKVQATIKKHDLKFNDWLQKSTKELKDGLVWEKIEKIYDVYLQEVQLLTTKKYHNFIANGFLVHNCGPCKMFSPTFESVSKKFEGKIKFLKVNVDDNNALASQEGVMSIPTVILYKNGEELERFVGSKSEKDFEEWLKKAN